MRQDEESIAYAVWLDQIAGLGKKAKKELIEKAGSPRAAYELTEREVLSLLGTKKTQLFLQSKKAAEPERLLDALNRKKIWFCYYGQDAYPDKLKTIADAPFGLYVKGRLPEKDTLTVAIVGARVCSGYGAAMAKEFGETLSGAGIAVVSGMARGIDGMSQWAACEAGGKSYGVLGCGVDVCYPEQNRTLYEALIAGGGVLSEYLPGTMPKPALFPPRNRIISGMADALLVIEAREKSGTLITVDMALEQGRDVYVLPGRVTDALSSGCNRLIEQGASIVLSAQELVREIKKETIGSIDQIVCETIEEENILSKLDYYPKSVEEIQKSTKLPLTQVMYELVQLCMEGKANQVSSLYFIKK